MVAKLLVRFKLIKMVPMEIVEINQMITPQLPISFDISIPGGEGELTVLEAELSIGNNGDSIAVQILCNFSVNMSKSNIYNSHIQLILDTKPDYCKINKTISPTEIKVVSMQLISDEYSMIQNPRKLIAKFLPEPLRTMFVTTLLTTNALLDSIGKNEMLKYLTLYLSGSKQRILDYHHADIENKIIKYTQSEAFCYQLDEADFDEKLFAEMGEQVMVNDEQLLFYFHEIPLSS